MLESNLSKEDLEELCRAFSISTEGVKADLVQRLKHFSAAVSKNPDNIEETGEMNVGIFDFDESEDHVHRDDFNIDLEARSLKELAYKSKGKSKVCKSEQTTLSRDEFGQPIREFDTRYTEINKAWPACKFEKLHDQHEYDSLCTIEMELDLAKKSRSSSEVITHIKKAQEADDWLKGKDTLIEKAKALAKIKKNKQQKTTNWTKNRDFTFQKSNNQEKPQHFYQNSYQNSYQNFYQNHHVAIPQVNATFVKDTDILQIPALGPIL
ncbi:424_t:CDS:2 [Dentiscutata erythropus]|uniref:424_t:CDS:1 n=1 Tax=Dentiscutata erythropus TaxID=1348616 RepID=A0A9N9JH51_9GLOM|nr:424_t:CDS:2 [Dentiscutata erythropus]